MFVKIPILYLVVDFMIEGFMPRKHDSDDSENDNDFDPESWIDDLNNGLVAWSDLTEDELEELDEYLADFFEEDFPELDYLDELDDLQDDEDFYSQGK